MFDPIEGIRNALSKAAKIEINNAPSIIPCKIVDVTDPMRRCRVRVQLRGFEPYATDWVSLADRFLANGTLPRQLIGADALALAQEDSLEHLKVYLGRPIVYSGEDLPDPCLENLGETITRVDGVESATLVCHLRNGVYIWEALSPLKHIHISGDLVFQGIDSAGDTQQPVPIGVIHDNIAATSAVPYSPNSSIVPPILTFD